MLWPRYRAMDGCCAADVVLPFLADTVGKREQHCITAEVAQFPFSCHYDEFTTCHVAIIFTESALMNMLAEWQDTPCPPSFCKTSSP